MSTTQEDRTQQKHFNFDKAFQERIIQAMIVDRLWAAQFAEVLDVNFFEYGYLKFIADRYVGYYTKYKEFPSQELLQTILVADLKSDKDALYRKQIREFLTKVARNENLGDLKYVKERALDFCKKQGLQLALEKSVSLIVNEDYDKVASVIKEALAAGTATTPGISLDQDIDVRYSDTYRMTVPTGVPHLDAKTVLNGGLGAGEIGTIVAPSGCHAKGTKILMFDGMFKPVEKVRQGEKIMGPDSKPRTVLALVRGKETMYRIVPVKGKPFVVNGSHVLSLCGLPDKKIHNKTVVEFLNGKQQASYKLYKSRELTFTPRDSVLPINPYVLGLLLGDGSLHKMIEITTADKEIKEAFEIFANENGQDTNTHPKKNNKACGYYITNDGKHNNRIRNLLQELKLFETKSGTKFIPPEYKTGTIDQRKQILAGLLDTDGHMSNNCYDFISKSKQLAEDVQFLCQSLGLAAHIKECKKSIKKINFVGNYHRVCISGDTDKIPCRLLRKQAKPRKQIKNVLHTGFTVEEVGLGEYFGFQIDHDHLYVMEDFFVTHNCGKSQLLVRFGAEAIKQGKNVVYYSFELNERMVGVRFDSCLCNIDSLECREHLTDIKNHYTNHPEYGKLIIKEFPTRTATVQTLRNHLDRLAITGFRPHLLLVDYSGIMRSTEKYELPRLEFQRIFEELRGLAQELQVPLWTATQSNKEGSKEDIIDMTNMAESYGQSHACDVILGLNRKPELKSTGYGTLFVAKNRAGIDGIKWHIHLDTARSRIRVISEYEAQEMIPSQKTGSGSGGSSASFLRNLYRTQQQEKADREVSKTAGTGGNSNGSSPVKIEHLI